MNALFSNSAEPSYQNMSCGLKVNTQSPNWYRSLEKTLKSIRGINYIIDAEEGTALVSGRVNPYSILKKLMKFKEHAEIAWIKTENHERSSISGNGYYETNPYQHHYPYHRGGYWPTGSGYDLYYGSSYGPVAPYGYQSTSGWRY